MYKPSKPVTSIISKQKYDRMYMLAMSSMLRTDFITTPLNAYLKSKFNIYETVRYPGIIHQGYGYIVLDTTRVLRIKHVPGKQLVFL